MIAYDPVVTEWLERLDLTPPASEHPDCGIKFSLSTAPLSYWIARKSRIPADALWFGVHVHRQGGWRVALKTRDDSLKVSWSATRKADVSAGSFLQKTRTAWPAAHTPDDIPPLVPAVEELLGKTFIREAELQAYSLKSRDLETLRIWLAPVCDSLQFSIGKLHGPLPDGVEREDDAEKGGFLQLTVPTAHALSFSAGV